MASASAIWGSVTIGNDTLKEQKRYTQAVTLLLFSV